METLLLFYLSAGYTDNNDFKCPILLPLPLKFWQDQHVDKHAQFIMHLGPRAWWANMLPAKLHPTPYLCEGYAGIAWEKDYRRPWEWKKIAVRALLKDGHVWFHRAPRGCVQKEAHAGLSSPSNSAEPVSGKRSSYVLGAQGIRTDFLLTVTPWFLPQEQTQPQTSGG